MKKIILTLMFIAITGCAHAQCVAEIKDVKIDEERGSIVVETEYKVNNQVVQTGHTRYLETSGTNAEIIAKAKEDIKEHCANLIRRIPKNTEFIQKKMVDKQKQLTQPIIDSIKKDLVGKTETVSEVTNEFKGISIKVTADEKNSVSNITITEPE